MGIQLKRPAKEPPSVLVKVRLPGFLAADLELYRELYRESYGEEIRPDALLLEIVRQFFARDADLKRLKRARRAKQARPGAEPAREPETP